MSFSSLVESGYFRFNILYSRILGLVSFARGQGDVGKREYK